jgi:hypothetical protein
VTRQRAGGSAGLNRSTGSAARLGNRTLGVGISTAFLWALLLAASAHPVRAAAVVGTGTVGSCVGDCDSSGEVTVNELITLVNIALGTADNSACPHGIPAAATVDISLIIQAVNNALNGCPAPPASPTPIVTPTVTPIPSRFVDNGDGTITDTQTGLMWEKKSYDGSIHDVTNYYTWSSTVGGTAMDGTVFTVFLAGLNTPPCFAGYCDWRLPTSGGFPYGLPIDMPGELESIVAPYYEYGCSCGAALCEFAVFYDNCTPGCTVRNCSCTLPTFYWSATVYVPGAFIAGVDFSAGCEDFLCETLDAPARAVRGG